MNNPQTISPAIATIEVSDARLRYRVRRLWARDAGAPGPSSSAMPTSQCPMSPGTSAPRRHRPWAKSQQAADVRFWFEHEMRPTDQSLQALGTEPAVVPGGHIGFVQDLDARSARGGTPSGRSSWMGLFSSIRSRRQRLYGESRQAAQAKAQQAGASPEEITAAGDRAVRRRRPSRRTTRSGSGSSRTKVEPAPPTPAVTTVIQGPEGAQ